VYLVGNVRNIKQVDDLGKVSSALNRRVGFSGNPLGGIISNPVKNIKISCKVTSVFKSVHCIPLVKIGINGYII